MTPESDHPENPLRDLTPGTESQPPTPQSLPLPPPSPLRITRRRNLWLLVALLVLIAVPVVWRSVVLSKRAAKPAAIAQSPSAQIIDHLNAVIQYYRASGQTIQKAGEPNDIVYQEQSASQAFQIANFAFASAKAEAGLLAGQADPSDGASQSSQQDMQARIRAREAAIDKQISDLEDRDEALDKQRDAATATNIPALQAHIHEVKDALLLSYAMKDALHKIRGVSDTEGNSGLLANINRIEGSVPELKGNNKVAAPQLTLLDTARSTGVASQGAVLFELLETRRLLERQISDNRLLQTRAQALRAPLLDDLRTVMQQGQVLSAKALEASSPPVTLPASSRRQKTSAAAASTKAPPAPAAANDAASQEASQSAAATSPALANLKTITVRFKALSAVTVPLSGEMILLEQSRANLVAWQSSTNHEYTTVLHSLLLRLLVIALALGLILGGGEIWRRATTRYIHDIRRRRQFLVIRRVVVTFLSIIVILFGFITQFHSLATFAGFITAGLAVGLQTILLSVAAYFFIIGRYGIKVGDRITIATVTGEIIEVGLVRFYMMELAGSGTSLNPTGRIAVFSNAVLFQAGTPLYKQIPGTEYAWHELIVKLADTGNYKTTCEALLKEVRIVYDGYRQRIEQAHERVENWMQASIDSPEIESRMQFTGGVVQLWVRFPVEINDAAETDEKITRALFDLITNNPEIKASVAAMPVIQASVRG